MINKIDTLLEQLESVCDEFDNVANEEQDFRTASRISTYPDHVQRGIVGLREMKEYLKSIAK